MTKTFFYLPLEGGADSGNSRSWGDASPSVQADAEQAIINAASDAGIPANQVAYLLAIVQYESGFNPDAANPNSTASGLGQLTQGTAAGAREGIGVRVEFSRRAV
jgi:soluble lytic murein transglycosylase-like protein